MNMNKQNDRDTIKLQVHLYSFICHLQVVSHGTIAFIILVDLRKPFETLKTNANSP